jgi:hypothetical protein
VRSGERVIIVVLLYATKVMGKEEVYPVIMALEEA